MKIKYKKKSESEAKIIADVVKFDFRYGYYHIDAEGQIGIAIAPDNVEYFIVIDE